MDPNTAITQTSYFSRLGTLVNSENPSARTKRSVPNWGDSNSPAVETNPPRQTSSNISSGQKDTTLRLSPIIGLSVVSSASEVHIRPQGSKLVKTKLPKKARGLSGVLSQINSELHVEDGNVPPELTPLKELPNQLPASSTGNLKHSRKATISATTHIQRVKDLVLFRSPIMPQKKSTETSRHESGGFISNTSSMHRNSLSSSSLSFCPPTHLGDPPTSICLHQEQSAVQNLFSSSEDPILCSPALNETANGSREVSVKQRRRMSFDFASLKQQQHPLPTLPSSPPVIGMQRSRSLWGQKVSPGCQPAESADRIGISQEPMSERQRALNVKRARKMTQVFGTEPPSSLYQIKNMDNEDDSLITPVEDSLWDSLPNVVSLSSLSIAGARSHSRSTIIVSDEDSRPADLKSDRPQTPPFMSQNESESVSSELSFKARRRRAAKLAHFFGVGYHDLSESMGPHLTAPTMPPPSGVTQSHPNPTATLALPSSSMEVDIKMSEPARFWSMMDSRRSMKDATVDDVIGRLREMKAR